MSVFTVLWLHCNGCSARFIPVKPISLADPLRRAAGEAGWECGIKGQDFCPRCRSTVKPRLAWARGICPVCTTERTVTRGGTVVLHTTSRLDKYGRRIPCDGGGSKPQRMISYGGKRSRTPMPGWQASA